MSGTVNWIEQLEGRAHFAGHAAASVHPPRYEAACAWRNSAQVLFVESVRGSIRSWRRMLTTLLRLS